MSERDVMALLATANPVRVGDLAPMEPPSFSRPRHPSRDLVLAFAVLAAAALVLIGVFVFPGLGSNGRGKDMEPRIGSGLNGVTLPPPPPTPIPVADISLMLGVPVALPAADATSASAGPVCPTVTPKIDGTCVVTVRFPSDSLSVEFWRPGAAPFQDQLAEAVRQEKKEAARHPGSGRVALLDLNGVQARYLSGDYSSGPEGTGSIDFLSAHTRAWWCTGDRPRRGWRQPPGRSATVRPSPDRSHSRRRRRSSALPSFCRTRTQSTPWRRRQPPKPSAYPSRVRPFRAR